MKPALDKKGRFSISAQDLIENYPPRFNNRYKYNLWQRISDLYFGHNLLLSDKPIVVCQYNGDLDDFDVKNEMPTEITSVDYYFDYEPSIQNLTRWYLNFADPHLFFAYGTNLFAQDELQCLEHPLLGSIREFIDSNRCYGVSNLTVEREVATPVVIQNVPQMVDVQTVVEKDGSKYSIYGSAFHETEVSYPDILDCAIQIKSEISESNIIAMSAPYPEHGKYRAETIDYMLKCAVTAFAAAKEQSQGTYVEIHSGRWGAGAFGGNEEIALLIQIIASQIAGVDKLVFHAVNAHKLNNAKRICQEIFNTITPNFSLSSLVEYLHGLGYKWGLSDGN